MKKLLLVHGGPGMGNEYLYPIVNNFKDIFDIHLFNYHKSNSIGLDTVNKDLDKLINQINYENTIVFAHSFGSIVVLNHFRKKRQKFHSYIFSNWIYDYDWLSDFLLVNKDFLSTKYVESDSLKDRMLSMLPLYFDDLDLGAYTLNRNSYNDEAFRVLNNEAKRLSFVDEVADLSNKILSISCKNDKIVSFNYIKNIVEKNKLESLELDFGAHFPFLSKRSNFFDKINYLINNRSR